MVEPLSMAIHNIKRWWCDYGDTRSCIAHNYQGNSHLTSLIRHNWRITLAHNLCIMIHSSFNKVITMHIYSYRHSPCVHLKNHNMFSLANHPIYHMLYHTTLGCPMNYTLIPLHLVNMLRQLANFACKFTYACRMIWSSLDILIMLLGT